MSDCEDVAKWKKRLRRKGPFFLYETQDSTHDVYNHSVSPSAKSTVPKKIYVVIWNDGDKTKIGSFTDYMFCRYGVLTWSVLKGETPFDLWNGQNVDEGTFTEMLAVRKGISQLPHFDLDEIKHINW